VPPTAPGGSPSANGFQVTPPSVLRVTLTGRHGVLTVRYRIEWVDAGHGYSVGTGTWHVVRGTGAYALLTGYGRSAHSWPPSGFAGGRSEGSLIPK